MIRTAYPTILIGPTLLLIGGCSDSRDNWFDSVATSSNGSRAYLIHHSKSEKTLLTLDLDSEFPKPQKIPIPHHPIEVSAGNGTTFSVVTRKKIDKQGGGKRGLYNLLVFDNLQGLTPHTIIQSELFIGSVAEVSDQVYAFQLGVKVLPSGRSVSRFTEQGVNSRPRLLSSKDHGYRVGVSVVSDNLVFLDGAKNARDDKIPDIVPIRPDALPPIFPNLHFSPNLDHFACSRTGHICFSVSNNATGNQSNYSHRLIWTSDGLVCKPNLPFKWLEFPKISSDGSRIVFLTTVDGNASPMGVGTRKLIAVQLYPNTCSYTFKQIVLNDY